MTRLESPSSINTFKQCKRKYFYSYKLELPRTDSIATLTGKAVHEALENFYKINTSEITKNNYQTLLRHELMHLFNNAWTKALPNLIKLENDKETIRAYYQDCFLMLDNFIRDFLSSLSSVINGSSFEDAFNKLKPKTEVFFQSEKHQVRGYIDAMLNFNNEVYIIDYKTSSRDHVSEEYELQLAIYALMFNEMYGKLPDKVGLHFLRHGTKKFLDVNQELIEKAKKECEFVHLKTISNDIADYEKNPSPLCRWKNGQCDYYNLCFGQSKIQNYDKLIQINKDA